jgi:hypothetical protein
MIVTYLDIIQVGYSHRRCHYSGRSAAIVSRPSSCCVRLYASADAGVAETRLSYVEGSAYRHSISTTPSFPSSRIVADALRVLPGAPS